MMPKKGDIISVVLFNHGGIRLVKGVLNDMVELDMTVTDCEIYDVDTAKRSVTSSTSPIKTFNHNSSTIHLDEGLEVERIVNLLTNEGEFNIITNGLD